MYTYIYYFKFKYTPLFDKIQPSLNRQLYHKLTPLLRSFRFRPHFASVVFYYSFYEIKAEAKAVRIDIALSPW